jgi:hypothetical protein
MWLKLLNELGGPTAPSLSSFTLLFTLTPSDSHEAPLQSLGVFSSPCATFGTAPQPRVAPTAAAAPTLKFTRQHLRCRTLAPGCAAHM